MKDKVENVAILSMSDKEIADALEIVSLTYSPISHLLDHTFYCRYLLSTKSVVHRSAVADEIMSLNLSVSLCLSATLVEKTFANVCKAWIEYFDVIRFYNRTRYDTALYNTIQ